MYGLIGKINAVAGQRDALVRIMLQGVDEMPGCLSYIVAHDPNDANAIWVTEVWKDEAAHQASLALPAIIETIAKAWPLIASFGERVPTVPVGDHGLSR